MFWNFYAGSKLTTFKRRQVQDYAAVSLYRTRQEIITEDVHNIFVPFHLSNIIKGEQRKVCTFKTTALPREDLSRKIRHIKQDATLHQDTMGISIGVVYAHNNTEAIDELVEALLHDDECVYTLLDLTSALITGPYHTVRVLYEQATNDLIIITNKLSAGLILKLGAVLPQVFDYEVDEDFINAFLNLDKDLFERTFLKVYEDYEANAARIEIERALNKCVEIISTSARRSISYQLNDTRNAITSLEISYAEKITVLKELLIKEASLYWKDDEGLAGEFVQYLKDYCMEDIVKMRTSDYNGLGLEVYYKSKLLYWDEEYYKMYRHSDMSNVITDLSAAKQILCDNIFKDKTVTVNMCTDFFIALDNGFVGRMTNYAVQEVSNEGCCNPHIYFYNCWGDNAIPIKKAINTKDYIVAWEQIKATLSGINLADSTVFKEFIRKSLFGGYTHEPILSLNDTGERISVKDFLTRYPEGYVPGQPAVLDVADAPLPYPFPRTTDEIDDTLFEEDEDEDDNDYDWED